MALSPDYRVGELEIGKEVEGSRSIVTVSTTSGLQTVGIFSSIIGVYH